jgi:hypothetical protein
VGSAGLAVVGSAVVGSAGLAVVGSAVVGSEVSPVAQRAKMTEHRSTNFSREAIFDTCEGTRKGNEG